MFDANLDTLIWALKNNGFANLPVIVSEIGWPIDGDTNANTQHAQRFNRGFMNHISTCQGIPMRPGPIDAYLFNLIDEEEKSIQPGNFERHWGLYTYDGWPKYQLNLGATKIETISYTCVNADCTSLGYKTSCGDLDMQGNISYAFNSYYQKND